MNERKSKTNVQRKVLNIGRSKKTTVPALVSV